MILGVDIGGTAVKMGLVDRDGTVRAQHEAPVDFDGYRTPVLTTVIREAADFLKKSGAAAEAIGVSATGQIDENEGTVIGSNGRIPGYEGSKIGDEMRAAFGVPVRVANDANAAALGECIAGAGRGFSDVLMVTIGTGVGGGLVLGGRLYGGSRGIAGEIGHFTLYQDGIPCSCGKRGCYECYASAAALVRAAKAACGEEKMDGREIFRRVSAGDHVMKAVLEHWMQDVAAGITGLVHILNPQAVIIGGGVSGQKELFIDPLRGMILNGAMPRFTEYLQVLQAQLGNTAGLIGAAGLFRE